MEWHCSQLRWIFPSQLIYSNQAQRSVSYLGLNYVNLTMDINHYAQEWPTQREVMRNIPRSLQRSRERTAIVCSQVSNIWVKCMVYIIKTHRIYYPHEKNVQGQQSAKSEERSWDTSDSCLRTDKHIHWEELGPQKPQHWHFQGTSSKLDGPFQLHSWIRTQNKFAWNKTLAYARPPSPSYCFCFSFSSLVLISGSHTEHLAV